MSGWSKACGTTTIGVAWTSAVVTVPIPPCVTSTDAAAASCTMGSHGRWKIPSSDTSRSLPVMTTR